MPQDSVQLALDTDTFIDIAQRAHGTCLAIRLGHRSDDSVHPDIGVVRPSPTQRRDSRSPGIGSIPKPNCCLEVIRMPELGSAMADEILHSPSEDLLAGRGHPPHDPLHSVEDDIA